MFLIGEGVFYPMHGAGIVVNTEEKNIYGVIKKYYVIRLIPSGMLVMIPIDSEDEKKLRSVIHEDEYPKVIEIITNSGMKLHEKWIDRFKYYHQCIRDGNIYDMVKILRDIYKAPRKKEISKSESKIFDDILSMVAGELSIVTGKDFNAIKKEILEKLKE